MFDRKTYLLFGPFLTVIAIFTIYGIITNIFHLSNTNIWVGIVLFIIALLVNIIACMGVATSVIAIIEASEEGSSSFSGYVGVVFYLIFIPCVFVVSLFGLMSGGG